MLKYLFFNWRFDRYAAQVERLIQLEMMLLTMQVVRGKPHCDEKLDKLRSQFQRNREATTQAVHQFKQHTKTWSGWMCSFIPLTRACRARRRVAGLLSHAKRQHGLLQEYYVGCTLAAQDDLQIRTPSRVQIRQSTYHNTLQNKASQTKHVKHSSVQVAGLSINSVASEKYVICRSRFFK